MFKYTPSIKFVGGPHPVHKKAAGVHPCAPNGLKPSGGASGSAGSASSGPIHVGEGEYALRAELPLRFRAKNPTEFEAEDIMSGGADLVY